MVELVLKEIADTLARGETVKLSSFGSFMVRKKGQRIGRNPKTGTVVPILPRRVIAFKPSAILKQQINGRRNGTKIRPLGCVLQRPPDETPTKSAAEDKANTGPWRPKVCFYHVAVKHRDGGPSKRAPAFSVVSAWGWQLRAKRRRKKQSEWTFPAQLTATRPKAS